MGRDTAMAKDELKPQQKAKGKDIKGKNDDALQADLKEMRKQLDALTASRTERTGQSAPASADRQANSGASASGTGSKQAETGGEEGGTADLSTQLQEFIDGMGRELKETNPVTLLAVFALGVLMGRLLPR
jgi:hypothetical protein